MGLIQYVVRVWKSAAVALLGTIASCLVATLGSLDVQVALIGSVLSCIAGLLVEAQSQQYEQQLRHFEVLDAVGIPSVIAQRTDLYREFLGLRKAFSGLVRFEIPLLEQIAALKLASMNQEILALSLGRVEFTKTETWLLVYEEFLLSRGLDLYRSVAWVRSEEYWQDTPGRQSIETNYEAISRGLKIQRIFILPESLLTATERLPIATVRAWMTEQSTKGIQVRWVRQESLENEQSMVGDFGIYGSVAVGEQEIDEQCRTMRFTLSFEQREVELDNQRWAKLALFSSSLD